MPNQSCVHSGAIATVKHPSGTLSSSSDEQVRRHNRIGSRPQPSEWAAANAAGTSMCELRSSDVNTITCRRFS